MKRGRKPGTVLNGFKSVTGRIRHDKLEPTSTLNDNAKEEFWRLVSVLDNRGSLERIDLAVVTECARITDLLNRTHEMLALGIDPKAVQLVTMLTSQRRGLLRELGMTIKPSNTLVKTTAKTPEAADPIRGLIKLA